MGEPKGKLVTPVADNPDDELRSLEVNADDELLVDVKTSALPTGASTSANQTTMITALQLIDDLRNSLGSVNTDDLQVDVKTAPTTVVIPHADEKLFGIESVIHKVKIVDATAASFGIASDAVPTGKIWKITHISMFNLDGDIATRAEITAKYATTNVYICVQAGAIAQYIAVDRHVEIYLAAGECIEVWFIGVAAPETCYLNIFGYEMNAP
uniref:Uncharacterized protein n=1 Tax=viral metagenome TaxID=1070528 RepID=A0A6H1ZNS6_9ZZZZ